MSGKGYIGKISAIVTVNTADASRAFNRSGKEAQTYAQGMRRAIEQATRDAGKSFDNIFTPFQKLQRALESSRRADFNLGNTPELKEQIRTVEQLALAARQLASPLATATKQFDGLAFSVQQGFGGALSRTQAELIRVRDTIQTATDGGEAGFRAVTAQVNQTIASIRQLAEASQKVSALPTGQELAFSDPRLSANLNAAAAAGQRAVALPRRVIESDPQIAQLTAQINRVSELAVAAAARVKGAFGGAEAQAAQQDYERLNAVLERSIARLNEKYRLFIDTEQAERNLEELQASIAEIRAAEDFRITGNFQNAKQVQSELQRVLSLRDQLSNSQNSRIQPLVIEALDAAASGDLDASREKIDALRLALEGEIKVNVDTREASSRLAVLQKESEELSQRGATGGPQGPPLPPDFGGQSDAGLGAALADPNRQLDALRGGITSVKSQIDQLPAGLRQQFIPAITAAEAEFRRLAAAPNQSAVAIDIARQRLLQLTREAGRASEALNFRRSFGSRDAIIGSLQTQQLRGYTAQVQILQGELANVTGFARGPAVAAVARLGTVISEQMRRGTVDTQAARQEVQRLVADAVRATAAARGISAGALGRTVARAGDVGRQGFANLSLGIQQAAFAFDDFFSVTGGLDQRIRAAGNNISQLGFVLGGTTGLITGIAISIGAQLVASIIKWTGVTEDAEKRQRELKDALSSTNSALERQRQLAEQLRDVYRDLAKSIAEAGEPERFRNERQQREQIAAVQRQQEERRRAAIEANSPQIAQQRGRIAEIDRQLETEQNAAARRRLIERRNAADVAVRREIDDIERRGAQNAGVAVQARGGITAALRDQNNRRDGVREQIDAASRRGNEGEVSRLSRELAVIENTIQRLGDASVRLGAERSRPLVDRITRLQEQAQPSDGLLRSQAESLSQIQSAAQAFREESERLNNAASSGAISFTELDNQLQQLGQSFAELEQTARREIAAIDVARQAVERFAESLNKASQEAQANLQSAQSAADDARRADLGRSTPQTQQARAQAEADLRRQQELASSVEQEIAVARQRVAGEIAQQAAAPADIARRRQEAETQFQGQAALLNDLVAAEEALDGLFQQLGEFKARGEAIPPELQKSYDEAFDRQRQAEEAAVAAGFNGDLGVVLAARELDDLKAAFAATIAGLDAELQASGQGIVATFRRIAEIDQLLATQGVLGGAARDDLVRERAALEQQAVEMDDQVRRARDESTREAEQAAAASRGRQLSMTDGERAAADLTRGLEDIRQFFGRQAEETTGLVDFEAQAAAQQRFIDQSLRSAAPAIFGLADQVQNAVLQGPSRAALEARDVSTADGARELSRLLRGEDPARDANLVELQKQSQLLQSLLDEAKAAGRPQVAEM